MGDRGSRTTVVVMTHNRRSEVLRTLAHMTSLPDGAPTIVVDNGSQDGTPERIRAEFPGVELIALGRNAGAQARNLAVERITTPYVTFCDDDTRWQPSSITRAVDLLDAHPGIAAVMGCCLVEPELREDPLTPELRASPIPAPSWLPGPALASVMAACSTFRVQAFRQVGGFSTRMWLGGEEELLALDLLSRGWWLCWRDDIFIQHAPSPVRDARRRRQLGIRNTLWTTWLRRPLSSALRRSATVLAGAPKDRCTAAAVTEALRELPSIVKERHVVPEEVERWLRLLEEPQRTSSARRYVG